MATALSATFQAGNTTDPARVLLQVTGAPAPPVTVYASNFAATVNGWTGSAGTSLTYNQGAYAGLKLTGAVSTTGTFSRTVTGLTTGVSYEYSANVTCSTGSCYINVSGMAGSAFLFYGNRTRVTYTFAATATSHVIQLVANAPKSPPATTGGIVTIDTVTVRPAGTWQGTTVVRTDASGTNQPVRVGPLGLDTTGVSGSATMTVTDYEAALTGTVSYTVTDGNGATANASVVNSGSPGVWLALPATSNPATPTPPLFVQALLVTQFDESSDSNGSVHRIVARADPIANPGPLSYRTGSVAIWCADYAAAKAIRTLLANGDVVHLRQPTYPGMDAYLLGLKVDIKAEEITSAQRWIATVGYQEVLAP